MMGWGEGEGDGDGVFFFFGIVHGEGIGAWYGVKGESIGLEDRKTKQRKVEQA